MGEKLPTLTEQLADLRTRGGKLLPVALAIELGLTAHNPGGPPGVERGPLLAPVSLVRMSAAPYGCEAGIPVATIDDAATHGRSAVCQACSW
ncbi:hypothetical protein NCC78_24560 [Micromonospora phytophila]|uniref:hypothetical protein n=1 Tax=Micromonospora phytophila TaxID=709888 RepID=UPI00202F946A|nr:hypothetical protein [Micromonospora phytophila]MCM0677824.1 hypothetical protein [Micromonospora phytophila]